MKRQITVTTSTPILALTAFMALWIVDEPVMTKFSATYWGPEGCVVWPLKDGSGVEFVADKGDNTETKNPKIIQYGEIRKNTDGSVVKTDSYHGVKRKWSRLNKKFPIPSYVPVRTDSDFFKEKCAKAARHLPRDVRRLFFGHYGL